MLQSNMSLCLFLFIYTKIEKKKFQKYQIFLRHGLKIFSERGCKVRKIFGRGVSFARLAKDTFSKKPQDNSHVLPKPNRIYSFIQRLDSTDEKHDTKQHSPVSFSKKTQTPILKSVSAPGLSLLNLVIRT